MWTILGILAFALVFVVVVFPHKAKSGELPIDLSKVEPEQSKEIFSLPSSIHYFQWGWNEIPPPIRGVVGIIDNGDPGVGLSAMQMHALGVGRGLVRLEFEGRFCDARVWNAFGPDALRGGPADIRITDSVAEKLGCKEGDEIQFVEVLKANLPIAR